MGEEIFSKAWTELWKEGKLPVTLHHENITVGALGWLKSVEKREKDILVEYSRVFYLLGDKFDNDSANTILLNFWNIVERVSKEPEKFGLTKEEEVRTLRCIEKIKSLHGRESQQKSWRNSSRRNLNPRTLSRRLRSIMGTMT